MAKAPQPGEVKTRLLPALTPDAAAALHRAFLLDTMALVLSVPEADAAVVCPAEDAEAMRALACPGVSVVPQEGAGLAAGLEFALGYFAGAGYRRVLLIDSDSPHLAAGVLSQALDSLGGADLVVGPTEDGGYYLVGGREAHLGLFAADAMGTHTALEALTARAGLLGLSASLLPLCFDVDTPHDLARLAGLLSRNPGAAPHAARCLQRLRML